MNEYIIHIYIKKIIYTHILIMRTGTLESEEFGWTNRKKNKDARKYRVAANKTAVNRRDDDDSATK